MVRLLLISAAVIMSIPSTSIAGGTDAVIVRTLNAGYLSCNPLPHTYDHRATKTIYYGARIICQASLAYIQYERKSSYI